MAVDLPTNSSNTPVDGVMPADTLPTPPPSAGKATATASGGEANPLKRKEPPTDLEPEAPSKMRAPPSPASPSSPSADLFPDSSSSSSPPSSPSAAVGRRVIRRPVARGPKARAVEDGEVGGVVTRASIAPQAVDSVWPEPEQQINIIQVDGDKTGSFNPVLKSDAVDLQHLLSSTLALVLPVLFGNRAADAWPPRAPDTRSVKAVFKRDFPDTGATLRLPEDPVRVETRIQTARLYDMTLEANGGSADKAIFELRGVLAHELVHAYQWDGSAAVGSVRGPQLCPSGLIEGIADYVRMKVGFSAALWVRPMGDKPWNRQDWLNTPWDKGQAVTGWFLLWLEDNFGKDAVPRINMKLGMDGYHEDVFWTELFGKTITELWSQYQTEEAAKHAD